MNILFDLDGTLTDSKPGILACIKHALSTLEIDIPADNILENFIGASLRDVFRDLLPGGSANAEIEHAVTLYRDRFKTTGLFENSTYAGISAVLESLSNKGYKLYLATSKPRVYAERILIHFEIDRFFEAVYGSELDGTRDHKGELIAHALKTSNIPIQNTYMIGDRLHDMNGAAANQIIPVGVLWGYGSKSELLAAGAKILCNNPEDLLSLSRAENNKDYV